MTVLDSTPGHLNILVAWPVMVSRDYVDLIYPCLADWVFQDGSQFQIESITQYLGPTWHEWLEWPRKTMA